MESVQSVTTNINSINNFIKDSVKASDLDADKKQHEESINLENLPEKKLKEIEKMLNNEAASLDFDLNFQIHRKSGKVVVKIVDKHTHKIIKEIPPESFLDFLSKFEETIGMLFDKKT